FELAAWRDGEKGSTAIGRLRDGGTQLGRLAGPSSMARMTRTFSPDGRWLVELLYPGESGRNHLRVWDCRAQRVVLDQPGPWSSGTPAFHPSAPQVLLQGENTTLRVVELPSGGERRRSPPQFRGARAAFSPDGRRVALASLDIPAQVVDAETWQPVATLAEIGATTAVAWNPVAAWQVVFGDAGGVLHVWDANHDARYPLSRPHGGSVEELQFS